MLCPQLRELHRFPQHAETLLTNTPNVRYNFFHKGYWSSLLRELKADGWDYVGIITPPKKAKGYLEPNLKGQLLYFNGT